MTSMKQIELHGYSIATTSPGVLAFSHVDARFMEEICAKLMQADERFPRVPTRASNKLPYVMHDVVLNRSHLSSVQVAALAVLKVLEISRIWLDTARTV